MDNVSIHVNREVEEVIREAGYIVQYLPPYSPDYNPIELTFSVLKAWVRRNYNYMRGSYTNFGDFLSNAKQRESVRPIRHKTFQVRRRRVVYREEYIRACTR